MLKRLSNFSTTKPFLKTKDLSDHKLSPKLISILTPSFRAIGYDFDRYTSYAITDKETVGKSANYALIPNQYFIYAVEMYELAIEIFKYFEIYDKLRSTPKLILGNYSQVLQNLNSSTNTSQHFQSNEDKELFARFIDKDDNTYRLGAKKFISDQGKPRGSTDCFGSMILKEINLPDASSSIFGRLVYDLCKHPQVYQSLRDAYLVEKSVKHEQPDEDISFSHLPKPFVLLAGISGTGKTRFVREQAKHGAYKLVSVRPDWHEPSDLLGYETRLTKTGDSEYSSTEVLKFIASAWKELVDNGFELETYEQDGIKSFYVSGEQDALTRVRAHWLCLDEMNLAPVEQYFSDYLSVLETRKWHKENGLFSYSCDALLDNGKLSVGGEKLKKELGMDAAEYTALWELFLEAGLPIPFNLIVAGTVNMDETTHGFSRKVIDRAISFDFNEFFPNDFDAFFDDEEAKRKYPVKLSFPLSSHSNAATAAAKESRSFLKAVNEKLKGTPFELAFRALNELLLTVESFDGDVADKAKLQAVWDDFLMMKLLPRVEGDADKARDILDSLEDVLSTLLCDIWSGDNVRPDLWRESKEYIACRSKRKIELMKQKLTSGFTSFWP